MKKYVLHDNTNPTMALREFSWRQENNNAVLSWEWSADPAIKFALIFECTEENPNLEKLLASGVQPVNVVRSLSSSFSAPLTDGRRKFLICPAYFAADNSVAVCPLAPVTDWIYQTVEVVTRVAYEPIMLSQYKKASISITPTETEQLDTLIKTLKYEISGITYPVDEALISSGGFVYINKSQTINFFLEEENAHLFELVQ